MLGSDRPSACFFILLLLSRLKISFGELGLFVSSCFQAQQWEWLGCCPSVNGWVVFLMKMIVVLSEWEGYLTERMRMAVYLSE
jgi:hypothetical protein